MEGTKVVQCLEPTPILIEACPWTIRHTRQKHDGVVYSRCTWWLKN